MSIRKAPHLLDEVRRFMRVRRYSIHTERAYCDWIKRYIQVLQLPLRDDINAVRAPERLNVPVVMSREEVRAVMALMQGTPQLIAKLLYGRAGQGSWPIGRLVGCWRGDVRKVGQKGIGTS